MTWKENIPNEKQVNLMLSEITNEKHRLIFLLVYAGLRAQDVGQLKYIDTTVVIGKVAYSIPPKLVEDIKKFHNGTAYLFGDTPYTRKSVELIIENAGNSIGIRMTPHYLRHA